MSVKGFFSGLGTFLLITLVVLALIFLAIFFVWGGVALSALLNPLLEWIFRVTSILLLVFVVFGFFKGTRVFASQALLVSSYILGFCLWMRSILVLYALAGVFWVIIGLLLGGVGVIPIAIIAGMFEGLWGIVGQLVYATLITLVARWLGLYYAEKAGRALV